jgi:hypothetical protein
VNKIIKRNFSINNPIFEGVYSYFDRDQLKIEFAKQLDADWICPIQYMDHNWQSMGIKVYTIFGYAFGTVKCWGEVVEHETGWRAQYAKLHSIDHVVGCGVNLEELRRKYLP